MAENMWFFIECVSTGEWLLLSKGELIRHDKKRFANFKPEEGKAMPRGVYRDIDRQGLWEIRLAFSDRENALMTLLEAADVVTRSSGGACFVISDLVRRVIEVEREKPAKPRRKKKKS